MRKTKKFYCVMSWTTGEVVKQTASETAACVYWNPGTVLGVGDTHEDAKREANRLRDNWLDALCRATTDNGKHRHDVT